MTFFCSETWKPEKSPNSEQEKKAILDEIDPP